MAEESILSDDFLRELMNVGEVDILVGLPTYNDARTVSHVVQAVRAGLLKYFPRQRAVIINADGGSKDSTQEIVRASSISDLRNAPNLHALRTLHSISTQYAGGPATGAALHTILAAAELLRASTCAVVSSDSVNIEPGWIDRLLRPISRDNYDLITPIYRRHKFEGVLVSNLLYPITRALYCKPIREPYPSEFSFSGRLATQLAGQDIWQQETGRIGGETFLVVSAISGGFQTGQAYLGAKSRTDHSAPADLVEALRQTVGVLFSTLEQNFPACATPGETKTQMAPAERPGEIDTEPIRVNRKRLHQMFVRGIVDLEPVLRTILAASTLAELQRAAALPEENFRYTDELWVRSVYEFAASYHHSIISRDHIVQALAPLYRGKAYTFLTENREASAQEVEGHIEDLCVTFEQLKPYLIELWNGRK
ncbi:MAG TPA: glycosyltransferase family A protein [Terriglobales bacterium]